LKFCNNNNGVICSKNFPKQKSQKKLSAISLMFPNNEKDPWKNKVICIKTLADRNVSKLRNRDETQIKFKAQNKHSKMKVKWKNSDSKNDT